MAHFRLAFVLAAFAILYTGIAVPEDQDTPKGGTIIGDIKDTTLRENYISGVRVVFVSTDGAEFETQSDKNGHFERAGLPAGQYVVSIYKPGYQDRVGTSVSVIDDGRHYVPLTMNISKNPNDNSNGGGVLRFWAYNRTKSGGPMEGLEIIITGIVGVDPPVETGISGAHGLFQSDKLSPGTYIVTLIKNDYSLVCPMTVQAGRITDARIFLPIPDKNTDANVPQAQESEWANAKNVIHGRILEMDPSYTLLSDVKVVIESADRIVFSDTSNADGEYECRGLSAGRYLISLHKDGYIEKEGMPLIVTNNGNHALGVTEEGMFVSYAVVADGSVFKLTHGMRKQ
ncbi:carboxypeptidase regulatory-like domain-containing protein [Candidatus Poribacteria bacterium]|nr:carboxypeptidase regulatory-like domain-containing protein [Candidatus Poribacteria bacterium]